MTPQNGNPGAGGAGASKVRSPQQQNNTKPTPTRPWLEVSWGAATVVCFHGREAQTLALLLHQGASGFTSGQASPLGWARRTSAYIFKLRAAGLVITTTPTTIGGGVTVGRYVLVTPVTVIARHGC